MSVASHYAFESEGTFTYTAAAAKSLGERSPLAAQVLKNLTTRCGTADERITLRDIKDAPFSGGVTTTVLTEASSSSMFEYTGTLTVGEQRAILDIQWPAPGAQGKMQRLHVDVSEDGLVTLAESLE
jgi:hypothetical protein